MGGTGMGTGNKGVQSLDLVRKPVGHKEFKRPIGDRRLRSETGVTQPVKHFVSAKCAMLLQQDFQRLAPHRREAKLVGCAMRLGCSHSGIDTIGMVVLVKTDRI